MISATRRNPDRPVFFFCTFDWACRFSSVSVDISECLAADIRYPWAEIAQFSEMEIVEPVWPIPGDGRS